MAEQRHNLGNWSKGLAEWTEDRTAFLSIAFTWRLDDAYMRAAWWRALGYRVVAGGPALFQEKVRHSLDQIAEIPTKTIVVDGHLRVVGADHPSGDAVVHHNPMATVASRGCPVGCSFCIVTAMEGRDFTLLPDFPVRPVLCDNNLSALPADYQDHIVARYRATGVPLLDANSGFEPKTFDEEVLARWRSLNKGPWRFAYDEQRERPDVERVMRMLRRAGIGKRRIQVYTLIGNEPKAACMERIAEVVAWGGEPYAQPIMKLTALERRPWVRFDWSESELLRVQRWCNYSRRAGVTWEEYRASAKTGRGVQGAPLLAFANG